jgi:hypothetical protein
VGRGKLAQIAVTNAVTFQSAQLDDVEGFVFNELKSNTAWLLRPSHGCDGLTDNWFLRFWSRGRELNSRPADYEAHVFLGPMCFRQVGSELLCTIAAEESRFYLTVNDNMSPWEI